MGPRRSPRVGPKERVCANQSSVPPRRRGQRSAPRAYRRGMQPFEVASGAQWMGMTLTVANRLLEHLSPSDLHLVADASGRSAEAPASWIVAALAEPSVHDAVFAHTDAPFSLASPFLVFSVAVHGVARDLASATLTTEWLGPRTRLPVFDAPTMREFLDDADRRFYLSQLLSSFTRGAGSTQWTPTSRGWRRSHFSELDPVQLAQFATMVSEAERPGVWRRLGDLSLFMPAVFPA